MKIKKLIVGTLVALLGMSLFAQTINHKVGYGNFEWGTSLENVKKTYKLKEVPNDENWSFMYEGYKSSVKIYEVTSKKDSVVDKLYFLFNDNKLFMARDVLKKSVKDFSALTKRYGTLETNSSGDYWNRTLDKDNYIIQSIRIYTSKAGNYVAQMYDRRLYSSALITPLAERESTGIVDDLEKLSNKLIQDVSGKPTYAFLALTSDDGNALVENYATDALTEAMFNTGKIKIVERASIEKILSEQEFQDSALVNENTASEIGNLTGANYVCYGTVKDLGDQITLNVKVVEVSTAELCSMGRETVAKDDYLKGVGFEARKSGGAKKTSNANNSSKSVKHVENNLWEVTTERNDFDEYTLYYFCNKGNRSDGFQLRVFYYKYDNPTKSTVWGGVRWDNDVRTGNYDFKLDSGEIKTFNLSGNYSTKMSGQKYGYATGKNGACRFLVEMFKNNDVLSIKRNDMAVKFQTAGFEEKMNENGITWEEIDEALSNLEF